MKSVDVIPVRSRRDKKAFMRLPWRIYKDDVNWMPPLQLNQAELVGFRNHPFYQDADSEAFLAIQGGDVVGRVVAILNHAHNRKYEEHRGFFGFFECVDDQAVADALISNVRKWFSERDVKLIRGPANPSLNYECGLLIDGFDSPPFVMMTYNPPYYPQLLENCGFEKTQDLMAFWGHVDMLKSLDEKLDFIRDEATKRFNVDVRTMNRKRFRQDVEMFLDIYNQSLEGTWGFVPLSPAEVSHISAGLRHLILPELALAAEVEGRPVGAVFAFLDYNPLIKKIDGRLFPFGFIRLLAGRRKIKRIRVVSTNVLPEYQKWGLGLILLGSLLPRALDFGVEEAEFSWVLESNDLSRRSLERGGAKWTKTYRIYDG